jgi:hypothetical protein
MKRFALPKRQPVDSSDVHSTFGSGEQIVHENGRCRRLLVSMDLKATLRLRLTEEKLG